MKEISFESFNVLFNFNKNFQKNKITSWASYTGICIISFL